jgi:hypothetical protein
MEFVFLVNWERSKLVENQYRMLLYFVYLLYLTKSTIEKVEEE